ncbi:DUF4097 family beta strand repeat-containing protein [Kitasatospora sp. MAP5-34]|uniref:DUF4097 family beta strand repeat-containing protein n=1 Tax=Kitasatospora sp. MAP5-34 TaxID=3035102 RepID=UPI002473F5F0|nr:DUF4097 family beta strand repeat-containing protein [Kitasatospora sp. MAP5-34]MDH6575622.1 uncharacterized protein YaiE (UPF0345 family) [Kitasatospora sp. MAP5-34]
MTQWTVSGPEKINIDEPVGTLHVRIIGGEVNVVATDGPARLEVTELDGEPLLVTLEDGVLTVAYRDLSWGEFSESVKSVQSVKYFFASLRRKRTATVSLAVPAGSEVKVGTISADVTVSGISGRVGVHGASGGITLVGLSGRTDANSVSGNVDVQSVSGELRVNSVSGHLTVVAGTADKVLAKSVSGAVTLDLDVETAADINVTTVSGSVGVRLPSFADTKVEAGTTSGDISSAFEELTVGGSWGAKRLSGELGSGTGKLQVTTVSGAVTVQRRPEPEDDKPSFVKELPAAPEAPSDEIKEA